MTGEQPRNRAGHAATAFGAFIVFSPLLVPAFVVVRALLGLGRASFGLLARSKRRPCELPEARLLP